MAIGGERQGEVRDSHAQEKPERVRQHRFGGWKDGGPSTYAGLCRCASGLDRTQASKDALTTKPKKSEFVAPTSQMFDNAMLRSYYSTLYQIPLYHYSG